MIGLYNFNLNRLNNNGQKGERERKEGNWEVKEREMEGQRDEKEKGK